MISVAVRTLCDFTARTGDLDLRYTPSPTAEDGIQGHRRVVSIRAEHYQAEYLLQGSCRGLLLRGRADGYDAEAGYLEEIKTHRGDLARVSAGQRLLHWAQLRTYGALLCRQEGLSKIVLRLVYYDIQSGAETVLTEEAEAPALWTALETRCERYRRWAEQEAAHRLQRDEALLKLAFPFPSFRSGQRSLAEAVYKTFALERCALLQAPTGSGKTVGSLYPALMSLPRMHLDRLFYLTVRNTGRALAMDGLQRIRAVQERELALRTLVLTAKEQACAHPELACHGESCPLARGFYDRLPAARQAAIDETPSWDESTLERVARRHDVCPYYLAQELARWADVVVADVNYFFDQRALLYALTQQNQWRVGVLIDEAHNLISRARGMYSIELSRARLRTARRQAPSALKKPLDALARAWRTLVRNHETALAMNGSAEASLRLEAVPAELHGALQKVVVAITDYLTEHSTEVLLQELLFEALGFMRLADTFADHSLCELSRNRDGAPSLAIHNLIPADFLAPRFAACQGLVLFSATLNPYHYHRDLLGLPDDTLAHQGESPFAAGQLEVRLVGISTRFTHREQSAPAVVQRVVAQFHAQPANYIVYTSSFAYLQVLLDAFRAIAPDIPSRSQDNHMTAPDRQAFVESFREGGRQVGFAVLGGAFSEGIDLPGSRLTGVFVVTLGLPPHDTRHEVLRQRLEQRFGGGYEYTYLYPALQKVVQAAGRVIRTPQDRGVIELIDARFARREVKALLPDWWPEPRVIAVNLSAGGQTHRIPLPRQVPAPR